MKLWLYFSCIFILPASTHAAVSINEVAWMGNSSSANSEWIELYNDGAPVDVSNWILSDGNNLNISLSGIIPAQSYVVLERSSEDAAPGTAFVIYTGALVNTGATLVLSRADGSIADQVSGGTDWQNIGGNNETKETAQYTTTGWITAVATPGQENEVTTSTVVVQEDSPKSSGSSKLAPKANRPEDITVLSLPPESLVLGIEGPEYAYVNQDINFTALAGGIGPVLLDSLVYDWNFGDSYTDSGESVRHRYQYPGTYVVSVYGKFARQENTARFEVTVLPVAISLTTDKRGDIQINNDSPYEIDMTGYTLKGEKEIILPPRTIILPNQTVTVASHRLAENYKPLLVLYDAHKTAVASNVAPREKVESGNTLSQSEPTPVNILSLGAAKETQFFFASTSTEATIQNEASDIIDDTQVKNQTFSTNESTSQSVHWTYFAFISFLLLTIIGIAVSKKRN